MTTPQKESSRRCFAQIYARPFPYRPWGLEYCPVSIGANGAAEAGCAVQVALAVQQESSGGATEAKALTRPDKGRRSP